MTTAYRDRLERELSRIRSVADDFEAALRVEALLNGTGESQSKVLELKVDTPKKTSGAITIRKVVEEPVEPPVAAAPAKKAPRKAKADHAMWRERVLTRLRENGPASSTQLLKHFRLHNASKGEKQVLYQVMYDLKRLGMATRDEEMVYHPVES